MARESDNGANAREPNPELLSSSQVVPSGITNASINPGGEGVHPQSVPHSSKRSIDQTEKLKSDRGPKPAASGTQSQSLPPSPPLSPPSSPPLQDPSGLLEELLRFDNLGDRLQHARSRACWRQKDVSEETGISVKALSSYENNKIFPYFNNVDKLARAFGVTRQQLMEGLPWGPNASASRKLTRSAPRSHEGQDDPHTPLGNEVLVICQLREKCRGRDPQIERVTARPPFHDILVVRFVEDAGLEGSYAVAVLPGTADATALKLLRKAMQAHRHVTKVWIICGEPPPEELAPGDNPAIHIKSLAAYRRIIDLAPCIHGQIARLAAPEHHEAQRMRYRVGQGEERRTEDAVAELLGWIARPGPLFTLLLGEPGVGKSHVLHQIVRRVSEIPGADPAVLVDLRTLDVAGRLDVLLAQQLVCTGTVGIDLEALRYMMQKGRLTLLLDGFDELVQRISLARADECLNGLLDDALDCTKIVMACRPEHLHRNPRFERVNGFQRAELERRG